MMPLHLGTACAVFDDAGRVLLSLRGDFNVWNLPGGRLDSGETLMDAAAREVHEETGIVPHIERVVGVYYAAGWDRLTVLFAGWPLGGALKQHTAETRANAFFAPDALPAAVWWPQLIHDACAPHRPLPRVLETKPADLRRARRRLAWRWVTNLLSGRPEPRWVCFQVSAVAVIWDQTFRRVLTLPGRRGRVLPRVLCAGGLVPWQALADRLYQQHGLAPQLHTTGIWQDPAHNRIELVFAAAVPEKNVLGAVEWSTAQHTALGDRDQAYVERVGSGFAADPIWTLIQDETADNGHVLVSGGSAV